MSAPLNEDPRVTAGRAIVAKVAAEQLDRIAGHLRAELESLLLPNEKVTAQLPDGTVVGDVARTKVSTRGVVTDEKALLTWVQEHAPEEIVRSVRPAYLRRLTDSAKRHGVAVLPDGTVVPGIEGVPGSAAFRTTPTEEGRAQIEALLRTEGLTFRDLALEPTDRAT